jgi:hypothetical protein
LLRRHSAGTHAFNLQPDIVSWAIWDSYGIFSYTSSEGCVSSPFGGGCVALKLAEFSTDANGNIIDDYGSAFDQFYVTSTIGVDLGKVICAQGNCQPTSYYLPLMADPPPNGNPFSLLIASLDPTDLNITTDSISNPFGNQISSSQDGVWSKATATPEPGTLFIFAAGLLGLAVVAGKRRFWARALPSEKQGA